MSDGEQSILASCLCRECEGDGFEWRVSMRNTSDVVDGRLRLSDVTCEFVRVCLDCSEAAMVIGASDVAAYLTIEME